ncbi:MAG: glycerate kinase [Spirochaetaceae bacterium]|jgi:glycerate kinase|nr:glycerate kinase [Spirochaetaceae bacterium]
MKKILLIPDSFKGTMSSAEICAIMERAILKFEPDARVISIPVADGGEGSVDAFLTALGGEKIKTTVQGPFEQPVEGFFGIINETGAKTGVVEMAAAAGLPLALPRLNPLQATTYGAGELIKAALDAGCTKLIIGLGGSATNDGGCGAAAALGVRFFDKNGAAFVPVGGTLKDIARIDVSGRDARLETAELITMCDIDNPLYGENGAAFVFAPQKGADTQAVQFLDDGLKALAGTVRACLGLDKAAMPGAGAAGGMGYGMNVFLGSTLKMGIETVLDTVKFDELLAGADCVFSGEGKIDTQSLRGKVVIGIARRTKKAGVPLIAVVGDIGDGIEAAYDSGVSAIFSINRVAVDFSKAKARAKTDMALTMENIMRFKRLFGG